MVTSRYAELEDLSHSVGLRHELQRDMISAEDLGSIIVYAWQDVLGWNANSIAPQDVFAFLLDASASADTPPEVARVIRIEERPTGRCLANHAQLVVGAQSVGAIGRENPGGSKPVPKYDASDASFLLDSYRLEHSEVVTWVLDKIRAQVQGGQLYSDRKAKRLESAIAETQ